MCGVCAVESMAATTEINADAESNARARLLEFIERGKRMKNRRWFVKKQLFYLQKKIKGK